MKVKKAVIPAAGLGTRFLPATKAQPKEMLPIVDKPTIQYIVEEAVQAGIEDIIIITGRGKTAIEDHFDKSYELESMLDAKGKQDLLNQIEYISDLASIHFVRQKEAKGLGHAVWCARKFVGNEPFAVMLGDDVVVADKPCIKQLMEVYEEFHSPVIGVRQVNREDVNKYGIVIKEDMIGHDLFKIGGMLEKPSPDKAPSNLAIVGRYILTPVIFDVLANLSCGVGGEIQLTDALSYLAPDLPLIGFVFSGLRYDIGDKLGYIKAIVEFALRREELREDMKLYLQGLASELEEKQTTLKICK